MAIPAPNRPNFMGVSYINAILFLPVLASAALIYVESGLLGDLIRFALFYLFVVLPAAILCSRALLKRLQLSLAEGAILGFPVAVVIFSALFYLADILGARWLNYPFALIPIVLIGFTKLLASDHGSDKRVESIIAVFFVSAAALFFVTYSITTVGPTPQSAGIYYQDSLWTVGNTWAIIRGGFPVLDARFLDAQLSYHMAQNIYLGFVHYVTGIDPFNLHLRIAPIYDIFFLVSTVTVGTRVFLGIQGWRVVIVPFVLLFTAGSVSESVTGYLGHIYTNPLSLFFGFHAYVLLLMLIAYHGMTSRVFVIYTTLVALLAFGTKASLALTLLPALVVFFLYRIASGYRPKLEDLLLAGLLIIVLILLRFTLYSTADGGMILRELVPLSDSQIARLASFLGMPLAQLIGEKGGFVTWVIFFGKTFIMGILTLYFIYFAVFWFFDPSWRKLSEQYWSFFLLVLFFSLISGIWVAFYEFRGGEVYFTWYAVSAFAITFALTVDHYLSQADKTWMRAVAILALLVGFLGFVNYTLHFFDITWWRVAVLREKPWDDRATISFGEWEAMAWAKENLPKDAVLISDRRGFNHELLGDFRGRFFGYSALSGMQFFNEGDDFNRHSVEPYADERWGLVSRLMVADSVSKAESIWSTIPAEFLIVSKRFSDPGQGLIEFAVPVFENTDVIILRKKGQAKIDS